MRRTARPAGTGAGARRGRPAAWSGPSVATSTVGDDDRPRGSDGVLLDQRPGCCGGRWPAGGPASTCSQLGAASRAMKQTRTTTATRRICRFIGRPSPPRCRRGRPGAWPAAGVRSSRSAAAARGGRSWPAATSRRSDTNGRVMPVSGISRVTPPTITKAWSAEAWSPARRPAACRRSSGRQGDPQPAPTISR